MLDDEWVIMYVEIFPSDHSGSEFTKYIIIIRLLG